MPPKKKSKKDSKKDSKKESKKEPKIKKSSKKDSKKDPKIKKSSKKDSKKSKELITSEESTEESIKSEKSLEEDDNFSEDININSDTEVKDCELEDTIDDDGFFENEESSEINSESDTNFVTGEDRKTNPRLTRYEMVRILGERIKQLTMGAKPLVKNVQDISYDQIALEELKLNMIPFKIKRPLPNNKIEIWNIDELDKRHLDSLLN